MSSVNAEIYYSRALAGTIAAAPTTSSASDTGGYSFANIATSTTTVVKATPGTLHSIIVNSKGTIASIVTVYNNTTGSGAKIATIDSLNLAGTSIFDVAFTVGLTIVTTGTVAPDITVTYK